VGTDECRAEGGVYGLIMREFSSMRLGSHWDRGVGSNGHFGDDLGNN